MLPTMNEVRADMEKDLKDALNRLRAAQEDVRICQATLAYFDQKASRRGVAEKTPSKSIGDLQVAPPQPPKQYSDATSVGRALTAYVRGAQGIFDVPHIVEETRSKFPDESYEKLAKRASSVTYRLCKRGEIELVEKGYGRDPHKYRRVEKKVSGAKGG